MGLDKAMATTLDQWRKPPASLLANYTEISAGPMLVQIRN